MQTSPHRRRIGFAVAVMLMTAAVVARMAFPRVGVEGSLFALVLATIAAAWVGGLWAGLIATALGEFALIVASPLGLSPSVETMLGFAAVGVAISWLAGGYQAALGRGAAQAELLKNEITEHTAAEARAVEREHELKLVSDHAPVLIAHCGADMVYRFVNAAYASHYGLHPRDIVGRRVQDVVGPDVYDELKPRIEAALTGRAVGFELEVTRTNGEHQVIRSAYQPELDEHGRVKGFVAAIIDVTERAGAEAALREADRRKDEFLAVLAHELRNPLAPIRNAAEVLRHVSTPDAVIASARDVIERQVHQMVRLIDDLLDVSRITTDKLELRRERVDARAIIWEALATTHSQVEASGHEVSVSLPEKALVVDADTVRLAQILDNLLVNACKYTDPHGHIWVSASHSGDGIEISVRDNGIGIPPEHLPRIFEKFSQVDATLDRSRGGLGLGLSLVQGLVRMHGGTVEARSDGLGKGAEFIVRLPAAPAATLEAPHAPPADAPRVSWRILVVDDNQDSAATLATLLELNGNEVHVAHDGLEALEVAARVHPDVVLLDLGMPRLNGFDTCRRMRQEPWSEHTVMIAVTGWGQDEDRRRTDEAGFDAHIVKPVELPILQKTLADTPRLVRPAERV